MGSAIGPFRKYRFSPGTTAFRFFLHMEGPSMISYRLYLFAQSHILTDQVFYAENDETACSVAALVAENCADRCHGFELWKATQLLMKEKSLHAHALLEKRRETSAGAHGPPEGSDDALRNFREAIEAAAVTVALGAMKLHAELDRSEQLNTWLAEVRNRQRQN
jgi:hypothetical protein